MKQAASRKSEQPPAPNRNDEFSFGSNTMYASNEEYATKDLPFDILAIAFEAGRGYEGSDRWAVTVKAEGREAEIISLGSNRKRDEQLRGAQAHLKRGGAIKKVRLRRSGNAYYFCDGGK